MDQSAGLLPRKLAAPSPTALSQFPEVFAMVGQSIQFRVTFDETFLRRARSQQSLLAIVRAQARPRNRSALTRLSCWIPETPIAAVRLSNRQSLRPDPFAETRRKL